MTEKFVAYYRVSTERQGKSKLGLEAQKKAVESHLAGVPGDAILISEFEEIESGKHNDRIALHQALNTCKKTGAKLVVAKLDRLSRNVAFLSALMESKVDFVCCDNPHATKFTLHILAAVAEHEREMISKRVTEALAVKKSQGIELGSRNPKWLASTARNGTRGRGLVKARQKALRAKEERRDAELALLGAYIQELRERNLTFEAIANEINNDPDIPFRVSKQKVHRLCVAMDRLSRR